MTCAVAYFRTSSATNVDGDSVPRQRDAVMSYANRSGLDVRKEFFDAAVKGADRIDAREQFQEMLAWCQENECLTIVVENASRFARDLIVQETGYQLLKAQGITLISADDPDAFTSATPTQDLIRQVLGAVSQFEKANLVAKLKAARDRLSAAQGQRIEGPKPDQAKVAAAKALAAEGLSLRAVAARLAQQGILTADGQEVSASQVRKWLARV
jgi:DNA invertase Pin-like site-specific DNA recombinase